MKNEEIENIQKDENKNKHYKLTKKIMSGVLVAALLAGGFKGCGAIINNVKESNLDTEDKDNSKKDDSNEISSTTEIESPAYKEEEPTDLETTTYSEWEETDTTENVESNVRARNVGQEIVEESSIVFETETESELETELETETEKETEKESKSSESEPYSESSDEDKSDEDKEEHEHNYKFVKRTVSDNGSDKEHVISTKYRCSCGQTKTIKKKEAHTLTNPTSIGKEGEEQHCEKCHHEIITNHDVTTYTLFTNNENGTHTENTIAKCKNDYCDYEEIIASKVGPHDCSDYVNIGEKGEESHCQSEGCDFVQTRGHKEKVKDTHYEKADNHQHSVTEDIVCENGCGYERKTKKLEDCIHENFVSGGIDYEVSICPDCGDELKREHSYEVTTVEYLANHDGTHVEMVTYECPSCGEKTIEEMEQNCVGDWVSAGTIGESQYCVDCGVTNTRSHDLETTTNIKYIGDGEHNHQHEVEINEVCQNEGCGYTNNETSTDSCTMIYKDNGENELAKCPTCETEVTRNHNMVEQTIHVDNKDGETHTKIVSNVCQNEDCEHTENVSEETEKHIASGPWKNNRKDGEINTCSADGCNAEMKQDHNYEGQTPTSIGFEYQQNGNHKEKFETACITDGCGYVKEEYGNEEACKPDMTKVHDNGTTVTASCMAECGNEDIVVHTHDVVNKYEYTDDNGHMVTPTCEGESQYGYVCDKKQTPYSEEHHPVGEGTPTVDELTGDIYYENTCADCKGTYLTMTSNDKTENPEQQSTETSESESITENPSSENLSTVTEEEIASSTEVIEEETEMQMEEQQESSTEVLEQEQAEVVTEEVESYETEAESVEEIMSEDKLEEAIQQIVEEVAQEIVEEKKNVEVMEVSDNLALATEKPLEKKLKFMYTIYNEYMEKKRRHYC